MIILLLTLYSTTVLALACDSSSYTCPISSSKWDILNGTNLTLGSTNVYLQDFDVYPTLVSNGGVCMCAPSGFVVNNTYYSEPCGGDLICNNYCSSFDFGIGGCYWGYCYCIGGLMNTTDTHF